MAENDFLQTIIKESASSFSSEVVDPISFAEASWGLNYNFLPVQKWLIKVFYRMPLDDIKEYIPVNDIFNEKNLYNFTEVEFLKYLQDEGRVNIVDYKPEKNFRGYQELIMSCGRRASKCQSADALQYTTAGIITIEELYNRLENEKIGIYTFDIDEGKFYTTKNIKLERNGVKDTLLVETKSGKTESTSYNHPYLVWNNGMKKPEFIEASKLKVGDVVACSKKVELFGENSIGINRAKILGYMMTDVPTTENPRCIDVCERLEDFSSCFDIESEKLENPFDLTNWLIDNNVYGCDILKKQIPRCIFEAPKREVSSFLNAIYSCDGHVKGLNKNNPIIVFDAQSKCLVQDIQRLLLMYGINSFIEQIIVNGTENDNKWRCAIKDSDSALVFCEEVGILNKKLELEKCIKLYRDKKSKNAFPVWAWGKIKADSNDGNIYEDEISLLLKYADNICWEDVVEIKDTGKKETYAMEVAETHVIVNQIITHNSSITSIIANYELYKLLKKINPQEYYGFPEGQEIAITCVATDGEQAGTLFDMIKSRMLNSKFMSDSIINDSSSTMEIQTANDIELYGKGKKSTIKVITGGCSSTGLRSKNNLLVILDEAAYFSDNNGKHSGQAVYDALTPSVASFTKSGMTSDGDGRVILLSSPASKSGLFWDSFNYGWNDPDNVLVLKMYSAMVNPTVDSSFLRKEYKKSPTTFMVEYGGEFSENTSAWIEDVEAFEKCINKSVTNNPSKGVTGVEYYMGIDLGLKNDATAISIVHKEDNKIILDRLDVFFSGSSDIWKFPNSIYKDCIEFSGYDTIPLSKIAERIKELCRWFPIKAGTYDMWAAGFALQEMLGDGYERITMRSYNSGTTNEMWGILEALINEQLLDIWDNNLLIEEIKSLECNRKGGNVIIRAPQREGFHDDASFAFAIACYLCYNTTTVESYRKSSGIRSDSRFTTYNTYYHNKRRIHNPAIVSRRG